MSEALTLSVTMQLYSVFCTASFEVAINDTLIFSKLKMGGFPSIEAVSGYVC